MAGQAGSHTRRAALSTPRQTHPLLDVHADNLYRIGAADRRRIVATPRSFDASDASRNPHKMDDLNVGGRILRSWIRLRALWTAWSVVVRVHSGALEKPANRGFS
jgi:hypothetical protein